MKNALATAVAATLLAVSGAASAIQPAKTLELEVLGSYASGIFDDGGAEITAYDASTRRAFVVNAGDGTVDVLDLSDPSNPTKVLELDVDADLEAATGIAAGNANSVAVKNGILAVAVQNAVKTDDGWVALYETAELSAGLAGWAGVGALPDMVTFTDDGMYVLTANEGEPSDLYDVDPEGSVSIISLAGGVGSPTVMTAGFAAFDADVLRAQGVRIFGFGDPTAAQDLEPEYIATVGNTAFVTLQENNALALVDIPSATVAAVLALGFKDHSLPGNAIDASDRDGVINIASWPVLGMYQPDSIAAYESKGRYYLVTANEGDARVYPPGDIEGGLDEGDVFNEEDRIKALDLDATSFPNADELQEDEAIGRLNVTNTLGDAGGDGDYDQLYAFGARSFSIWDAATGELVWDSGDALEQLVSRVLPADFNSTNDENDSFDNRSDNKGPEPEGVAIGKVEGRTYAFIGLERVGGIAVYDVSNPYAPVYMDYLNNRDFDPDADCEAGECGDLGPEGLTFVSKEESPNGEALLIAGNEVSGTTTVYQINVRPAKARASRNK